MVAWCVDVREKLMPSAKFASCYWVKVHWMLLLMYAVWYFMYQSTAKKKMLRKRRKLLLWADILPVYTVKLFLEVKEHYL